MSPFHQEPTMTTLTLPSGRANHPVVSDSRWTEIAKLPQAG